MNKIYSGIMGLVVGDALGVPVEFEERDTYHVTDMIGYGTYRQLPGTWSDDSSMALATAESIARLGRIDPADIMQNFLNWYAKAEFTPYGAVFDCGMTTARAILNFGRGVPLDECGGTDIRDNGNGALMRILPVALVPHTAADVRQVAGLTHNHLISHSACAVYVEIAEMLLAGDSKAAVRQYLKEKIVPPELSRLAKLEELRRDEIKSSGYVIDTLEAALWCFLHTDGYRDCVLAAVNLGDDTDTVAAVVGGLAGVYYGCNGENGIPSEWIEQIPRREWIAEICAALVNRVLFEHI